MLIAISTSGMISYDNHSNNNALVISAKNPAGLKIYL